MKKIFSLCAVAVLTAFTAFSQCTTGGTLFGTVTAPCDEAGPASVNIAGFEVWRGDIYSATDVQAGASYSFDICQGTGGTAWNASLTVVAPSGAVDAFGTDGGSPCEISFTASESGTYQFFVNEVGECPGVSQDIDNGIPRINYFSGATCPDPVTECEAGTTDASGTAASLCPGEATTVIINGTIVPNSPTQGGAAFDITPVPGSGTGGNEVGFSLTGFTAAEFAAGYTFDNDLNGVLSFNLLPPLAGEWEIEPYVFANDADVFTKCDSAASIIVNFLTLADEGCSPVTACEAGTLDEMAIDNTLCPGEATDFSITGITVPNSPVAGEYLLIFDPVPGSGAGGPFAGESVFLTLGAAAAGDENVDIVASIDAELLITGGPLPAFTGDWTVSGGILTGVDPITEELIFCDVIPTQTLSFLDETAVECGGTPECALPYPDVQNASAVQNGNGSITYSWDPIPGQIGCQVNVRVGDPTAPTAQQSFIIGGPGASQFNASAGALAPFGFQTINFRVRCGCQQNPSIIASQFTEFSSVFNIPPSLAEENEGTDLSEAAAKKLFAGANLAANLNTVKINRGNMVVEEFNIPAQATIAKATYSTKTEMSVFPNPTEGAVNINYTAAKDGLVNVRVFDVVGKAVADFNYAVNAGDNFLNMDLSSFENGVYVIEVLEGKNSTTSRVMLK